MTATRDTDADGPLPALFSAQGAIVLDAIPDQEDGLVVLMARAWPWAKIAMAPEVALELARRMVVAVADLTPYRGPRRRRP
jgi:hypothetical protein